MTDLLAGRLTEFWQICRSLSPWLLSSFSKTRHQPRHVREKGKMATCKEVFRTGGTDSKILKDRFHKSLFLPQGSRQIFHSCWAEAQLFSLLGCLCEWKKSESAGWGGGGREREQLEGVTALLRWCYTGQLATPTCNADSQRMFFARICRHDTLLIAFKNHRVAAVQISQKKSSATGCYTRTIFRATSYHCKLALQVDQCNIAFMRSRVSNHWSEKPINMSVTVNQLIGSPYNWLTEQWAKQNQTMTLTLKQ